VTSLDRRQGGSGTSQKPSDKRNGCRKTGVADVKGCCCGAKREGGWPHVVRGKWGGSPDDKGCARPVAAQNMGLIGQLTGGSGLLCWQFNQSQ
jgi:hypothetical protein